MFITLVLTQQHNINTTFSGNIDFINTATIQIYYYIVDFSYELPINYFIWT